MNSRLLSSVNFMLDVFVISFVLIFIEGNAIVPLAVLWILLNLCLALVLFLLFLKKPYQPAIAIAAAAAVMALSLAAGASLGIFAAFTLLAVYRLHARFSVMDDGSSQEGNFQIVFALVFSAVLLFSLLNPGADAHGILYPIAIAAIVFYLIFRLLYRYLQSRSEGARLSQVLLSAGGIIGASGLGAWLVYVLAEETRLLAGSLLGGVLSVVLWPFAAIMEWVVGFVSGLSTEQEMQETMEKFGPEETVEQTAENAQFAAGDFQYGLVVTAVLIIAAVLLVIWLRKVKTEKQLEQETPPVEIRRFAAVSETEQQTAPTVSYAAADLHMIRQAFRELEMQAREKGQGRKEYETVREWVRRLDLPASENFFGVYDFIRYGDGDLSEQQALPFFEEIKKINEKILKENV